MTNKINDSRVLSVFAQSLARGYMISTEQRITSLETATAGSSLLNYVAVEKTSSFSTSSSTEVDVTGLSLSITTTGGNLLVVASANDFYASNSGGATGQFGINVNGTTEFRWLHGATASYQDTYGLAAIALFTVSAGTHTVKGVLKTNNGTVTIGAGSTNPMLLIAIEI